MSGEKSPDEWMLEVESEHTAWRYGWPKDGVPEFQNLLRKSETKLERGERIYKRKNALQAKGLKDFTEQIAQEEGVSKGRVRQLISDYKKATLIPKMGASVILHKAR